MSNEWENEPNVLRFIEDSTGLECLILRMRSSGSLCGYVIIPKDNKLYGKKDSHPMFDNIMVHGGVTFADNRTRPKGNVKEYMIGFGCSHIGDLAPNDSYSQWGTYRNIEYVKSECISLAKQLWVLSKQLERKNMTYNEVLTLLTNIHEWCKDRYRDKHVTCEDDDNNYELLWEIENVKYLIEQKESDLKE